MVCDRDKAATSDRTQTRMPHSITVEGAAVAVVQLAPDGTVSAWNPDATRLFGWEPGQIVGRPFHQVVDPVAGQRPPDRTAPSQGVWQGVYSLLAGDGSPVRVFASHTTLAEDGSAALLMVPEGQRMLLEHPAVRQPARAVRRDSDPLGLRDDALLRLAVDDYLPLSTERVRDALDADAAYLLIGHEVDDAYEVVAVSGLPDSVRGTRVVAGEPGAPDARSPHLPAVVIDAAKETVLPLRGTPARSMAMVPVSA